MIELNEADPAEFERTRAFADIEAPSGNPETNVAFMLHWPPIQPGLKDYGSIFENDINASIEFVRQTFPDFTDGFAFDLICKRYHFVYENGQMRDAAEIYQAEQCYPVFLRYTKTLIDSLQATNSKPVLFVFGKPASRFIDEFYTAGDKAMINAAEVSSIPFVTINVTNNVTTSHFDIVQTLTITSGQLSEFPILSSFVAGQTVTPLSESVINFGKQQKTSKSLWMFHYWKDGSAIAI